MDVFTLLVANAVVSLVMGVNFLAAWMARTDQDYWLSWALSCALLALAFVSVAFYRDKNLGEALPYALLVLGFGLRWHAARLFTGRAKTAGDGLFWIAAPALVLLVPFAVPGLLDDFSIYLAGNFILACQSAAIAWHFYVYCHDTGLPRWGLILAYGVNIASFGASVALGALVKMDFASFLSQESVVAVCLMAALVHNVASGIFALVMAFTRSVAHVRHEHELAEKKALSYSRLAERDALTGLMNRRAVEARFIGLQRSGFTTVAVLDLDHFKDINDRFGHAVGDAVLRKAAVALAPDEDCLAVRLGGEEFMLILRGGDGRQRAEQRRQSIAQYVAETVEELDREVTASMGVVELPPGQAALVPFSELYIAADRLLYQAKQLGRNRTAFGTLAGDGDDTAAPTPKAKRAPDEETGLGAPAVTGSDQGPLAASANGLPIMRFS